MLSRQLRDVAVNTWPPLTGATVTAAPAKTLDVSQRYRCAEAARGDPTAPCAFVDAWAWSSSALSRASSSRRWCCSWTSSRSSAPPVGALPVHGMAGIWGTLACDCRPRGLPRGRPGRSLRRRRRRHPVWVQFYGVAADHRVHLHGVVRIVSPAIKYTVGLRVSEAEEPARPDISEYGMFGYPSSSTPVRSRRRAPGDLHAAPAGAALGNQPLLRGGGGAGCRGRSGRSGRGGHRSVLRLGAGHVDEALRVAEHPVLRDVQAAQLLGLADAQAHGVLDRPRRR